MRGGLLKDKKEFISLSVVGAQQSSIHKSPISVTMQDLD
jgi:hypothetical protein